MADIHIQRQHAMGLAQARKATLHWAQQAQEKFDMECTYQEGSTVDEVSFKRSGVTGTLTVSQDAFELHAKLGFLLGAFKDTIEAEIVKNLDALVAKGDKNTKSAKSSQSAAHAAETDPSTPAAKKPAVKKPTTKKA